MSHRGVPSKLRRRDQPSAASLSAPAETAAEVQAAIAEKENAELRQRVDALRSQIRLLQCDICGVHHKTEMELLAISRDFAAKFEHVTGRIHDMDGKNDEISEALLQATGAIEVATSRVEEACAVRIKAEEDHRVVLNSIAQLKAQLAECDAEMSDFDRLEADLQQEMGLLAQSQRSGALNLEEVRLRNAQEEKELAMEEARLDAGLTKLANLRTKISDLKAARQAVTS